MNRTQVVTLTNMCMIYQGSRVLVLDKTNCEWSGITFPGGHVEKDEFFAASVVREVYEETGLTIQNPQLCGVKDWINEDGSRYIVLLYKTDKFSGELKSSDEGEVYWIELEELLKRELSQDFPEILKVFFENDISEFYYYLQDGKWLHELK